MKILVLGNGSLSVANQEKYICNALSVNNEVTLISNPPNKLLEWEEVKLNFKNHIIPYQEYNYDVLNIYIEEHNFDVCLGLDQSVCAFVADYKSRHHTKSYCMFLDFPVHCVSGQDLINYNFSYAQRYYYWLQCSLDLDGLIFNNTVAIEEYYKRYKRIAHLVFYPVISQYFIDSFDSEPTKDYVVGCHRLIGYKGTDYTLKALRKLHIPYKHIFVSGDKAHMDIIEGLTKELSSKVEYYKCLNDKEKMFMLYNSKFVSYPQITEWIGGMSIIEGWSVGTPGVCFDYPVLRELYGDYVLYAKPHSVIELRWAMEQLWNDKDLNQDLATNGYKRYKELFTLGKMAENFMAVFHG